MVRIWSIVIVVICIEQTHGAVAVSLPRLHPDYPGQCYDVGGSVAYAVGDHYPASRCERVICRSDYSLEWQTCTSITVSDNHRLVEMTESTYPSCCPAPVAS